ncbi:MAG: Uma2 family endonuclease, partial [Myxococcales bacterium]|nr:Uma2 family endonuclease [Myxococcales bacterium]
PSARMSSSEYLEWEREQLDRHEFHDGEVFAMSGGSLRHSALALAIGSELRIAARGSECTVHSSDQRVVLRSGHHYVYPDVSVVCGRHEIAEGSSDLLANPCIIVEVLSRSTEAYDRGDKWAAYRQLESLSEYVLVSQTQARIEVYRREGDGWRYEVVEAGCSLTLAGRFTLAVDAIYEGVLELPAT